MFGAILKATNSSFQKGMTFCRSLYVKKVMKLLAFIFEQPSYAIISLVNPNFGILFEWLLKTGFTTNIYISQETIFS